MPDGISDSSLTGIYYQELESASIMVTDAEPAHVLVDLWIMAQRLQISRL
jgi:hypothetical protein